MSNLTRRNKQFGLFQFLTVFSHHTEVHGIIFRSLDYTSQKEHDPSKLLADTPCKLLRFLVADGSHVDADTPYAEVEVMKMCMPLLLPASGVIHFVMPEGQAMQVLFLYISLPLCLPPSPSLSP